MKWNEMKRNDMKYEKGEEKVKKEKKKYKYK